MNVIALFAIAVMLGKGIKTIVPKTDYDRLFDVYGKRYNIPSSMLKAIAYVESSFNPRAVGRNGKDAENWDYGLMQINGKIARGRLLNYKGDLPGILFDPEISVDTAARLIDDNRRISGSSGLLDLISAYNWGLRNGKVVRVNDGFPNQSYVRKVAGRMMLAASAGVVDEISGVV